MRIATWNVNSLKARLEKVRWWLERARPDVLLMQETKLVDSEAPVEEFRRAGYTLSHHGEGRWNGVAIASLRGAADIITNFGEPLRPAQTSEQGDDEPFAEARMLSAVCDGIRVVCLYAPNGRVVGSPFYEAKLAWFDRLSRWLEGAMDPKEPIVLGGDLNVAPEDIDVWDPRACHGGTHVSAPERQAFARLTAWGLLDVYRRHHSEARPLLVVGLSRGQFSQELRYAHRSSAAVGASRRARRLVGDRSGSAQRQAHTVGSRAAGH